MTKPVASATSSASDEETSTAPSGAISGAQSFGEDDRVVGQADAEVTA